MLTLLSKLARLHTSVMTVTSMQCVGQSDCQYLRKAVQGCYGQVQGAGSGLSFIGLQHFCLGSIQPHHLVSNEAKTRYINQARAY